MSDHRHADSFGRTAVFTVGHSTHSIQKLIALLTQHAVTAVADVRSQPHSRFNPQFNRESLRVSLRDAGIAYAFLGRELGARSEDPQCYVDGRVQYDRLASTELFRSGLSRIQAGAAQHRIALLCAEKDPLTCHRGILIARRLADLGVDVVHMLEDGRTETHEQSLLRLLRELGLDGGELFRGRDSILAEAYERRGNEIAYVVTQVPAHETGEVHR